MPPFLNVPSSFLALPIVGSDTILIFRRNNYANPIVVTYSDLVAQIINSVPSGSGLITSVSDTADIDLSVAAGVLTALLTATGVTAGTYGDSTHVPQIIVDDKGRITSVTSVAISTGGTGTVTSVGATAGTGISVSVANPTTTPVLTITNTAPDQTVSLTASTGIVISGTYPNFTITNSLPDQTVVLNAGAGIGVSGTYPNFTITNTSPSSGGGASLSYYLNGSVSQGTFGGVAFKQMSRTPVIGAGTDFTINADGYIQSFITDANVPNQLLIPAGNWNFETYFSASSSGGSPSFYIELYKWNGTTLTLIASNSTTPESITGGTAIDLYTSAVAVPQTTLASTDRIAIRIYVTHSGRTITLHTEDNHLCQVITTFSTGITALNGLTDQVQSFATGTSGTDFAIVSSGSTHTFNLPTASASNRGALSSTDWTTFNNKVPYTGATGNVTLGSFNLTAAKLFTTSASALASPATLFAVIDSTEIKTRTPAQVLSDIGAAPSTGIPVVITQENYPTTSNSYANLYVASVGKLYVCNNLSNTVFIYNVSTGALLNTISVTTAFRPLLASNWSSGSAVDEVWITSTSTTTITRISVSADTSPGTIALAVGSTSGFDIVNYSSTKAFITNSLGTGVMSVINPTTLTLAATITSNMSVFPCGMAYNSNGASSQNGFIVVACSAGVLIFNPATNTVSTTVANPSSAISTGREIRYNATKDKYYVANSVGNTFVELSIATATTFTPSTTIRNIASAFSVQIDEASGYMFVSSVDSSGAYILVNVFNYTTLALIMSFKTNASITSGATDSSISIDTSTKKLYVIGRRTTSNAVSVVKYY